MYKLVIKRELITVHCKFYRNDGSLATESAFLWFSPFLSQQEVLEELYNKEVSTIILSSIGEIVWEQ